MLSFNDYIKKPLQDCYSESLAHAQSIFYPDKMDELVRGRISQFPQKTGFWDRVKSKIFHISMTLILALPGINLIYYHFFRKVTYNSYLRRAYRGNVFSNDLSKLLKIVCLKNITTIQSALEKSKKEDIQSLIATIIYNHRLKPLLKPVLNAFLFVNHPDKQEILDKSLVYAVSYRCSSSIKCLLVSNAKYPFTEAEKIWDFLDDHVLIQQLQATFLPEINGRYDSEAQKCHDLLFLKRRLNMVGQSTRSSELTYLSEKKICLIATPKADWNSAFSTRAFDLEHLYKLSKTYSIVMRQVSSAHELKELMESFPKKSIDLLMINGHGSPSSIRFGYGKKGLWQVNGKENFCEAEKSLSDKSTAVLVSCSVGKKKKLGKNMHEKIASLFPRTQVFAPTKIALRSDLKLDSLYPFKAHFESKEKKDYTALLNPLNAA
jgi:oligoribonuclease NrnB/cAMP/cGMP phosphodiesterase (DHH superfamily)